MAGVPSLTFLLCFSASIRRSTVPAGTFSSRSWRNRCPRRSRSWCAVRCGWSASWRRRSFRQVRAQVLLFAPPPSRKSITIGVYADWKRFVFLHDAVTSDASVAATAPGPGAPSTQSIIVVGVSTEVTVGIALASFVIGVGLTAILWCIHMRTGPHNGVTLE